LLCEGRRLGVKIEDKDDVSLQWFHSWSGKLGVKLRLSYTLQLADPGQTVLVV
jgi:hypothetical protein